MKDNSELSEKRQEEEKPKRKNYVSNKETLLRADTAIENLQNQAVIKEKMAVHGYGEEQVAGLSATRANARAEYHKNEREGQESLASRATFEDSAEKLFEMYGDDRKKAKRVFREEPEILAILELDGRIPTSYAGRIDIVKLFYRTLSEKQEYLDRLTPLMITAEHVTAANSLIDATEKAREAYFREKGESEASTPAKNAAFRKLDKEMGDMYTIAAIALKDTPQLLEALGKKIKS